MTSKSQEKRVAAQMEIAEGTAISLNIPMPKSKIESANKLLADANSFVVATADAYQDLSGIRQRISSRIKELEEEHEHLKAPVLVAGRRIDDLYKPSIKILGEAKVVVTGKLTAYDAEQRRIAAEKQREADERARIEREKAEAAARAERERQAAIQREQERQAAAKREQEALAAKKAAEALAAAEKAKREAAEAAASGDRNAKLAAEKAAADARAEQIKARAAQIKAQEESERLAKENERLRLESESRAQQLEQQAANVKAETVKVETADVAGLSRVSVWKWELVDKSAVKSDYLVLDEKLINKVVQTAKGRAAEMIGGIRVFEDKVIRQR